MSVIALPGTTAARRRPGTHWTGLLPRRKTTVAGRLRMPLLVALGVLAPIIGGDPAHMDVAGRLAAPGRAHWFGTDDVGRDVWSRVVFGARLSLLVGAAVVVLSFLVGVICGVVAGYYRGLDNVVMRVMDGLMAFPAIILAIALMAALVPHVRNLRYALAVLF